MSRISIDVTPEEHQRLKAMAALSGKSMKDFVLASTLGQADNDAAAALLELESVLDQRIADADANGVSDRSVGDIFQQAREQASLDA